MPERNQEYRDQGNIASQSRQAGHENSPEFTLFNESLAHLNAALNRMSQEGYQVTAHDVAQLRQLYTTTATLADAYIAHLPTWLPDRWRSTEGLARQAGVQRIREFMRQDMAALDNYGPHNPMGINALLKDARNLTIDEPDRMGKVGNNMSSRNVIEQGGKKGVFTEDVVTQNEENLFSYAVDREMTHLPANDPQQAMLTEMRNIAQRHPDLRTLARRLKPEVMDKLVDGLRVCNLYDVDPALEAFFTQLQQDLQREGCPYKLILKGADLATATQDDVDFTMKLGDILEKNYTLDSANGVLTKSFNVEHNRSVGDRNTAMSIVGDLLYQPDLLARSSDMKMRLKNGNVVNGSYMEWAPGSELSKVEKAISGGDDELLNATVDLDTPEFVKQAGDIMALDYICGNIDRHMGNFHVSLKKDQDGIYRLDKLTGIDNDQSFPVISPKDYAKRKDKYVHIQTPESISAMKFSTAMCVLSLTKEKLAFALQHKLSEKEIASAWERTQYLQQKIVKGMNRRWTSEDEIAPGAIHVIPDGSKAWDRLNLSAVASMSGPDSFYQKAVDSVLNGGLPGLERTQKEIVRKRERDAVNARADELRAANDPAVVNNPKWVNEQLDAKALSHAMNLQNREYERKYLDPEGPLKKLPAGSRISVPFTTTGDGSREFMKGEDMYQVYHSRRNMLGEQASNAARTLRAMEDQRMTSIFGPGYDDHSVVKAAGMENPNNRYFIDGEPAEQYARRKYWTAAVQNEYNALHSEADKKRYMKNFVSAQILGAMTGGRHHVDVVALSQGDKGQVQIRTYEVGVNLKKQDFNGRQKRIDKILKDDGGRTARQRAIYNQVSRRLNQKFLDGTLDAYKNNMQAMQNARNQNVQNQNGGHNRLEQIQFEALNQNEVRPRSGSLANRGNVPEIVKNQLNRNEQFRPNEPNQPNQPNQPNRPNQNQGMNPADLPAAQSVRPRRRGH